MQDARESEYDEYYTHLSDIENELQHYEKHFRGKVVYCNCDDPTVSNFFRYFIQNFSRLGLKRLITTCYKSQQKDLFSSHDKDQAIMLEYDGFWEGKGEPGAEDIGTRKLKEDGDFRNQECIEILKRADIVVTNPPFSQFIDYINQLFKYDKKFLILGTLRAVGYKDIYTRIQKNRVWLGVTGEEMFFDVPDDFASYLIEKKDEGSAYVLDNDGNVKARQGNIAWFTNLEHVNYIKDLELVNTYSKEKYPHYDNFDGIEVSPYTKIPKDWGGGMGVPVSSFSKLNPDQFEIIQFRKGDDGKDLSVNGKTKATRVLIRNKKFGNRAKKQNNKEQNKQIRGKPSNTDLLHEGFKRSTTFAKHERSKKNREAAIQKHGVVCFGCQKAMAEIYGKIADGYIHIHHVQPISEYSSARKPNINELVPLCPNCHAVVHLEKPPITIEQLQKLISKAENKKTRGVDYETKTNNNPTPSKLPAEQG